MDRIYNLFFTDIAINEYEKMTREQKIDYIQEYMDKIDLEFWNYIEDIDYDWMYTEYVRRYSIAQKNLRKILNHLE